MANLKELRTRIASVQATRKITRAMQMVAASRLVRAQNAVLGVRPFAQRMETLVSRLGAQKNSPLLHGTGGTGERYLLLVMTASRGLCGGFNSAIVRLVRRRIHILTKKGKSVQILYVGRKGYEALRREAQSDTPVITPEATEQAAHAIAQNLIKRFFEGKFDVAEMFYARFVSVITQTPTQQQLLPLYDVSVTPASDDKNSVYEFEPEDQELLDDLLPYALTVRLLHGLLENAAGEQGARMSAMDAATRNAAEMIENLTLTYNRTRQAMITRELIEIISGAEIL